MKGIKSINDSVINLPQVDSKYEEKLNQLGIFTIKDLLVYFPRDYKDSSNVNTIADLSLDPNSKEEFLIKVHFQKFKSVFLRSRRTIQTAIAYDETDSITCMWFNQPFLKNTFSDEESEFLISGKIRLKGKKLQFFPTNYEKVITERENVHLGRIAPEYPLTEGVSKKWFRNRVKYVIDYIRDKNLDLIDVPFFKNIPINDFIYNAHFPENFKLLEESVRNLSLVELTNIHLKIIERNSHEVKRDPIPLKIKQYKDTLDKFIKTLPFKLTIDQKNVLDDILKQIEEGKLLNELIQGDVGSGKTIIVIYLSLLTMLNGYQSIILAPTTVLAKQHFETFKKFLKGYEDEIELVIGEKKKSEAKKIIIGTSAVLARKTDLIKNIGFIVVDEQHRFGVEQRENLIKPFKEFINPKNSPHFINMTATPIPRTIAETFFGNVHVNLIKSKPKDRLDIKTFIINEDKRENCLEWLQEKIIKENEQIYWICSLIEDSEEINAKSAKDTFEKLSTQMKGIKIGLLHGKMKPKEKDEVMQKFIRNEISVLVSTTVIEVGIDVPNANIMIIENPDRFGLAQLHQIRGRVGRSSKQAYCFLFKGKETSLDADVRLDFFSKTNDGLKIAEFDLQRRGPGEVYGTRQSGIPALKIAKLNNLELLKQSKLIAEKIYQDGVKSIVLFE